jgi:hypothetical protein
VARWLRRESPRIVNALQPREGLDPDVAMTHAVRMLSIAALLRRQSDFPSDRATVVQELLEDGPPLTSVEERDALVRDVWNAHPAVKEFVLTELSVPQGGSPNINFIDPLPLLKHAWSPHTAPKVAPLDREFINPGQFWQTRFGALKATDKFADLQVALIDRRAAIVKGIVDVQAALIDADVPLDDLSNAIVAYCKQITDLLPVQKEAYPMPDETFDSFRPMYATRGSAWARTIAEAMEAEAAIALLTTPMDAFREAVNGITAAHGFVRRLASEVDEQERALTEEGDPIQMLDEIRSTLTTITDLATPEDTPQ